MSDGVVVPDGLGDRAAGVRAAGTAVRAVGEIRLAATAAALGHGALADAVEVLVRRWDVDAQLLAQRLDEAGSVLADNAAAWQALDDLLAQGG